MPDTHDRPIGLVGATGIGVGAIVGGGILALAGVAFGATGPTAALAFALNGVVAWLTAMSFAELSSSFPEGGGPYAFAKKVLSVRAAFVVGWIVWFASVVAAVLYALGFATFTLESLRHLAQVDPMLEPAWLDSRWASAGLAILATSVYAASLARERSQAGQWANVGKLLVFGVLIAAGVLATSRLDGAELRARFTPALASGPLGLVQAMGFTFIAVQGFDLIAAAANEIRAPERTVPRAMFLSLGIAMLVYLPLLVVIAAVGTDPGRSIAELGRTEPETVVASAARRFLGPSGYWLVMAAGILSMLSALQANLFAASRIALAMARDRTLPHRLEVLSEHHGTPVAAIWTSAALIVGATVALPDVAAAGAAASLIFLVTFAATHGLGMLARSRGGRAGAYRVPLYPAVPVTGGLACLALAVFQGVVVPPAGLIAAVWIGLGTILYAWIFKRRASVVDASAEVLDPDLLRLRGRNPLVLVPVANPASTDGLVHVAHALAPPGQGRVLLLSVVNPVGDDDALPRRLLDAQRILGSALAVSFGSGLRPQALTTVAEDPWREIGRVAHLHACESLLIGFSRVQEELIGPELEDLMNHVDCDVVVLRAPPGWEMGHVRRVLAPVGGRGGHDALRARLLASLRRAGAERITFLQILDASTPPPLLARAERELKRFALEEVPTGGAVEVLRSNVVADTLVAAAREVDLVVLGLTHGPDRRRAFGNLALRIARETIGALIMISHLRGRRQVAPWQRPTWA